MFCSLQCTSFWLLAWVYSSVFYPFLLLMSMELFLFNYSFFLTLQHCTSFTICWLEYAMGVHVFPILKPPPNSLPIPSLWVIPVHQPREPVWGIVPRLAIHFTYDNLHVLMSFSHFITPLPLSHRVQKTIQYICVSIAVSHNGLSLPSF